METVSAYERNLNELVRRAVVVGAGDFRDVCIRCRGADPKAVTAALERLQITDEQLVEARHLASLRAARARKLAGEVLAALPGANPDDSQWWFSLDCIERLCEQIYLATGATKLVHIGTSTLASYYQSRYEATCSVLDVDADVVDAINEFKGAAGTAQLYDAASAPPEWSPRHQVAVIDPPWYEKQTIQFLTRASQLVDQETGVVFSTIPGEYTRPSITSERTKLAKWAEHAGLRLEEVQAGLVEYSMPEFERTAFRSFEKIQARPWRYADWALFRKVAEPAQITDLAPVRRPQSYSRGARRKLRLFLHPDRIETTLREPAVLVPEYSATVSSRSVDRRTIGLWTSTNVAFRVRDYDLARRVLEAWQSSDTQAKALAAVSADDSATLLLKTLYEHLELPDNSDSARRRPDKIAEARRQALSVWAEPEPADPGDGYRNRFARDRDRVLWSNGIRQLANKTQVFSTRESDHIRQRLTHSTEVMQLASTVGTSLGLDRDLIEAGALAHDIGHTPFGHAGEVALARSLRAVSKNLTFNHYEHGLDVVVWLEDAYRHPSNGEKFGLELTNAVLECIFKHAYNYDAGEVNQLALYAVSKHQGRIRKGPCHLEGQAVRAADKISYLISDMEDGLRLGAITLADLRGCRLFSHPPIDLMHEVDEDPLTTFVAQRRSIIGVLMEDLIDETARRLAGYSVREDLLKRSGHTVEHSDTIRDELAEVWKRVQAGKLHHDARVVTANRRAAHIVSRLFMVFCVRPDLVDAAFRRSHEPLRRTEYLRWYADATKGTGVHIPEELSNDLAVAFMIGYKPDKDPDIADVVLAKDYVASMTDQRALRVFQQLFAHV